MNPHHGTNRVRAAGCRRRSGSIYIIVLVTTTIVMLAAMSGLALSQANRRSAKLSMETQSSRLLAQAGLELALATAKNTSGWRSGAETPTLFNKQRLGAGVVTVTASVPSTTLPAGTQITDGPHVPVDLLSDAVVGGSRQLVRWRLVPDLDPLDYYASAIHTEDSIVFTNAVVRSSGRISSRKAITSTGSNIWADLYAKDTISGATFHRGTYPSAGPSQAVPSGIIAWYSARATSVAGTTIDRVCLGPGYNPLGTAHPQGVYVFNAGGGGFIIRRCRIVGTVIVLNAARVRITQGATLEPGPLGWPTLIVASPLECLNTDTTLSEASQSTNFNPAAVPYDGTSDSDMSDTYPVKMAGDMYVQGSLDMNGLHTTQGCILVTGAATVRGSLITNPSTASPPPKFVDESTALFVPSATAIARVVQ